MATGGHWVGGSVGTRGDYHFGQDENDDLMEGAPALLIGAEGAGDIELDCDEETMGCGMPGDSPWADVTIAGDVEFGVENLISRVRGWWAGRKAAKAATAAKAARAASPRARGNIIQQAAASGDPYALGQGLGQMQDMDSEVEALNFAVANDPYAIGQPL